MRPRQAIIFLAFLAVAVLSTGAGGVVASAQPAADDAARADTSKQAKRGKGKRPSCRRFCAQAGGFGADCDEPDEEDCYDVDIPVQTVDGVRDQIISIRATCKLTTEDCVGAIIVSSYKGAFEYGRADLEIPAGQTAKVKVGISKKSLEYLKKHGKDRSVYVTVPLDREPDTVSFGPVDGRITILPPG